MQSAMESKKFKILEKETIAEDTFLFRIEGKISFNPGQFLQVSLLHFGEATYAICSNPREKEFFEICVRGCGNTSNALIKLLPGDDIYVRGPYGNGWPTDLLRNHDIVLVTGGMGIVPIRPLIFQLLDKKIKNISLFAGFKSHENVLFESDLLDWKKKINVMAAAEYSSSSFWGEKGLITQLVAAHHFKASKTIIFMCGPEAMCPYCNEELFKKGIKENQIFISFERKMGCGVGVCQHCNIGKYLVCEDGPVFRLDIIKNELRK